MAGRGRRSDTFQQISRADILGEGPLGVTVRGTENLLAHGTLLSASAAGWDNALLGGYQMVVKPAVKAAKNRTHWPGSRRARRSCCKPTGA